MWKITEKKYGDRRIAQCLRIQSEPRPPFEMAVVNMTADAMAVVLNGLGLQVTPDATWERENLCGHSC